MRYCVTLWCVSALIKVSLTNYKFVDYRKGCSCNKFHLLSFCNLTGLHMGTPLLFYNSYKQDIFVQRIFKNYKTGIPDIKYHGFLKKIFPELQPFSDFFQKI